MRIWIIALSALLVLPAVGAAATIVVRPVEEQLVEGHTVFTVIEVARNNTTAREEFHAAVAVLVREVNQRVDASRFPGVLWFNDQYLYGPRANVDKEISARYPCTGAVLATSQAYTLPIGMDNPEDEFTSPTPPGYNESYWITDPNDNEWVVDKWNGAGGFIWTVPILNNELTYSVPDNGVANCNPYEDNVAAKDPGENGLGYPCGLDASHPDYNCPNLLYNAVLYFRMIDLPTGAMIKDHDDGSVDRANDASGCHQSYGYYGGHGDINDGVYGDDGSGGDTASYYDADGDLFGYEEEFRTWPCPEDDDSREGNSHDYNPEELWPLASYAGRNNHGGSAVGCGNPILEGYSGEYECHSTADILIYYGTAALPLVRTHYIIDIEGSSAPFHCHDDREVCNFGEFLADPAGYGNDATAYASP